jgi:peroxiredoxin
MQAFRDTAYRFEKANAQVLGISVDSWASAGEFQEKLGLEFPLLSDWPKNEAGRAYGVLNEQFSFHNRTTVVVDRDGIVREVFVEARQFDAHPMRALEVLASLGEDTSE